MRKLTRFVAAPAVATGLGLAAVAGAGPTGAAPAASQVAAQAPSFPTVRPGDRGPAVTQWQHELNVLIGAGVAEDGIYGPNTVTATENFQRFFGLRVDGIAGPDTRQAMYDLLVATGQWEDGHAVDTLSEGDRGPEVADWQSKLNRATGANLVVDGVFGPNTVTATENLQRFFGQQADGIVDADTRDLMAYVLDLKY